MSESRSLSSEQKAERKRDSALVREILDGNALLFSELMSLHKSRVAALGMSFFKNASDAEDFVQDVFLKAYSKLDQFRGDALFSTWLTRLAYNTAVNSAKRTPHYVSIANEDLIKCSELTPEEEHLRKITKSAVREAMEKLDEKYRICLDLYFFYDNSYAQISEITGFPENTVKSHIFRAKKILREKLLEQGVVE